MYKYARRWSTVVGGAALCVFSIFPVFIILPAFGFEYNFSSLNAFVESLVEMFNGIVEFMHKMVDSNVGSGTLREGAIHLIMLSMFMLTIMMFILGIYKIYSGIQLHEIKIEKRRPRYDDPFST